MNKFTVTIITIILALGAVIAPIMVALNLSFEQSLEFEMGHVVDYALDALGRSDATADQFASGVEKLEKAGEGNQCSDRNINLMRDVAVSSTYLQAIGFVSGNSLVCSSLGTSAAEVDLGPVDLVTTQGAAIRTDVRLPFAAGFPFLVIEYHHYAAIVHKSLPIDATTLERDVSLATFSLADHRILASRGVVEPGWIDRLQDRREIAFADGGYVVAVVRSNKHLIGALAALPLYYVNPQERRMAIWLVPIATLAGLTIAAAVCYVARRQMSMPTALKAALRKNQFFLQYQPVVDLQSGRCIGAEALIRWRLPNGDIIRPDLFIPIAEQTGLIERITRRVIELIINDVGTLFAEHPDFHIAINFSSADFHSELTLQCLRQLVKFTGGNAGNIIIEVTERGLMKVELAQQILQRMRSEGMLVAIDDFGTGYSSLSYLEKFDLDYLKIDKAFVDTIGLDVATSQVVFHIIEMARALDLKMIAEGVETEVQAKFLRDRGVQFAQGWLFGKPTSFNDLMGKIAAQPEGALITAQVTEINQVLRRHRRRSGVAPPAPNVVTPGL